MAEAPRTYPVNLIDECDGTVLVTSPDFPELTTFGAVPAEALAHAVGAFAEANRMGIDAPKNLKKTPKSGAFFSVVAEQGRASQSLA